MVEQIAPHNGVKYTATISAGERIKTGNAVATLSFAGAAAETLSELSEPIPDYELLSDEDIEALF